MLWLAQSPTEALPVLSVLSGHVHQPTRNDSIRAVAFLVLFGLVCPAMVALAFFNDPPDEWFSIGTLFLASMIVWSPILGLWLYSWSRATVYFKDFEISVTTPTRIASWVLRSSEIESIFLMSNHGEYILEFRSVTGEERRVEVDPEMRERLFDIFPSIGSPDQPILLPGWLGRVSYLVLSVVVVSFVILVIWLTYHGFIEW